MSANAATKARRPKGTGSIRHMAGDRYQLLVKVEGHQVSRVFTARNETEANKAAGAIRSELVAEHARRQDTEGAERERRQAWTVKQYSDYYMRTWAPLHLADTTRERRQGIFDNQVVPLIGRKRMIEVTPDDLAHMYAALGAKQTRKRNGEEREDVTLSGNTILTIHTAVRALFAFAYETKADLPSNPAARKAARPHVTSTPRRYAALTVEQVERIVSDVATDEPRMAVAVMLTAYLGTRRGETVALCWQDVDFDAGTITVRRSVSWTPTGGLRVKSTKTGKERTIPLDSDTLEELKRIQTAQRKERVRLGKGWRGGKTPGQDHIAAEPDGSVLNPAVVGVTLQRVCKKRKTAVTMHQLRHSWVSQQIANGFDAVTIAAMSGHSPDVLLRVYAHAFDTRKREAMDALGEDRKKARAALKSG